jgi:hypothetical protein
MNGAADEVVFGCIWTKMDVMFQNRVASLVSVLVVVVGGDQEGANVRSSPPRKAELDAQPLPQPHCGVYILPQPRRERVI